MPDSQGIEGPRRTFGAAREFGLDEQIWEAVNRVRAETVLSRRRVRCAKTA